MKATKIFTWMIFAISMLFASAFAGPINVGDLSIQENNGEYDLIVSLTNTGVDTTVFDELSFTIEELGTTKNVGTVRVDVNETEVFSYSLEDITDSYDLLKMGETYRITASAVTSTSSDSEAFLFGPEVDSDGLSIALTDVEINNIDVNNVNTLQLVNGETVEVQLTMAALSNVDDARIMLFIEGYEHAPLIASTEIFSLIEGKTYVKTLSIDLPADIENQDDYTLRIVGANELSGITYKEYTVYVDTQRHRVDVLDLVMTPSSGVEPGQNIIANVRMKNRGQQEQDSVRVSVSIPELGVDEASYVSNLNSDEVATSDDMLLFIPEDAQAKTYEVLVTLAYDDGYTASEEVYNLNVIAPRLVQEENLIVSFKNNVELVAGRESTFEIVVGNPNDDSKPISVVPIETAWADLEVSPTLAMVQGGASETFVVSVTPKRAAAGSQDVVLVVKEGASAVNEFEVSTFVDTKGQINWFNVVLVVLLILAIVILLALVISIAKRKNDGEEDISSSEEYY